MQQLRETILRIHPFYLPLSAARGDADKNNSKFCLGSAFAERSRPHTCLFPWGRRYLEYSWQCQGRSPHAFLNSRDSLLCKTMYKHLEWRTKVATGHWVISVPKSKISKRHVSSSRTTASMCFFYYSWDFLICIIPRKIMCTDKSNKTEEKVSICFRATALVTHVALC